MTTVESGKTSPKYTDHPAPSVVLVLLHTVLVMTLLNFVIHFGEYDIPLFGRAVTIVALAILAFYLWPMFSTYYTLDPGGITVRYGPWTRTYPWTDFSEVYWQKGMFTTRIGWPSVTPCVRLTNAVSLKRTKRWRLGLYLTPNEPRAFLHRMAELAPALTEGMIV